MSIRLLTLLLLPYSLLVDANVEKETFVAPPHRPADALLSSAAIPIELLSPAEPSLSRQLHSAFPDSPPASVPREVWILLDGLEEARRYETRICWSATQASSFALSVHEPAHVFSSPLLNASLGGYLSSRRAEGTTRTSAAREPSSGVQLLLHVSAAAAYFTTNKQAMRDGLLVDVDIILDPYIINVLPKSLVPTGIYLLVLAVIAWFLSAVVWQWLDAIAHGEEPTAAKED